MKLNGIKENSGLVITVKTATYRKLCVQKWTTACRNHRFEYLSTSSSLCKKVCRESIRLSFTSWPSSQLECLMRDLRCTSSGAKSLCIRSTLALCTHLAAHNPHSLLPQPHEPGLSPRAGRQTCQTCPNRIKHKIRRSLLSVNEPWETLKNDVNVFYFISWSATSKTNCSAGKILLYLIFSHGNFQNIKTLTFIPSLSGSWRHLT